MNLLFISNSFFHIPLHTCSAKKSNLIFNFLAHEFYQAIQDKAALFALIMSPSVKPNKT